MRFVSVRDLRGKSSEIWKKLAEERELIITSNGKPIAILSSVSEETLEESLRAVRRARAIAAVETLQRRSAQTGRDQLTSEDVEAEIATVRSQRTR